MASTFLNISVDSTLGGEGASDSTVSSQAAIKTYVDNEVSAKQDTLVSGTNIKTINGNSLLGSGNIVIEGGGSADIEAFTASEVQTLWDAISPSNI